MRREEIAARYGRALFELAKESKNQELVYQEVNALAAGLEAEASIKAFASSPLIGATAKEEIVEKSIQSLKISALTKNFILTLARRDRLELIADVGRELMKQMDAEAGVTRGTVTSATELSDAQKKDVTETLTKLTGKKVVVNFHKDPSIGGGLSAEVGGLTIDDSVQTHLKRLRDDLNRRTH